MRINLVPDTSVGSAPAGFTAAVQAAAAVFDQDFPGNYTVNISYGWGTFDNQPNSSLTDPNSGDFSLGGSVAGDDVTYATLKSWLTANATLSDQIAADASLPATSASFPGGDDNFYVSNAEEKALGVLSGSNGALDGSIGFNVGDGDDAYYWETAAFCEIGHALGWDTAYYSVQPSILDLFRFSSPGQREWTGGQPAYFSTDGGATHLADFSTTFDYTLFTNVATNDPFNVNGDSTPATGLTSLDIEVLNLLGFGGRSATAPPLVAFGSATFSGSNLTLSGAAAGAAGVEIMEGASDLGAASLDTATGAWSFSGAVAASDDFTLEAVATNGAPDAATATLFYAVGGGQTFAFPYSGDLAYLSETGGDWDTVNGSDGTIELSSAQARVNGGDDTVDFLSGSGNAVDLTDTAGMPDRVNGSDDAVDLNSAQTSVFGYHDTVDFQSGAGDSVGFYDTSGKWDFVEGSGGAVALSGAKAAVSGYHDTITFAGGTGNAASLYDTSGKWDFVDGSGGLAALFAAKAAVQGEHDMIQFAGGTGDAASFYATGGWDYLDGSSGVVALSDAKAVVTGNSDTMDLSGTNAMTINGGSDTFVFQAAIGKDFVDGFNSTDSMQFSAADFLGWSALSGHVSQAGSNTVIVLDSTDIVTLADVTATSLQPSQFRFV